MFNKTFAGQKLKSASGEFEVDKQGYVEIGDESLQKVLLGSGWVDASDFDKSQAEGKKEAEEEHKKAQEEAARAKELEQERHARAKQQLRENGKAVVEAIEREKDMVASSKKAISAADDRDTEREFVRQEVQKTGWKRTKSE